MVEKIRNLRLQRLHGRLGHVVYELTKVHFSQYAPPKGWQPAINAYRCANGLEICVDLAGVDKAEIDLRVEPGRLQIRGRRQPPEPEPCSDQSLQILEMEIDSGPFEREVRLPADVDADRVTADQRNGLLWIHLPYRTHA